MLILVIVLVAITILIFDRYSAFDLLAEGFPLSRV